MAITLELFELKNLCMDMAALGVAEYVRTQEPARDLISQREAYRIFQEKRVKGWRQSGLIVPVRIGSAIRSKLQYSRAELMAIDRSERMNFLTNKK